MRPKMRPKMRDDRRAITLVELMVFVGLLTVVMNLLSMVLVASTECTRTVRRRADSLSWARSALDRFKADVRAASGVALGSTDSAEAAGLRLSYGTSGGEVRYDTVGGKLVRRCITEAGETHRQLPMAVEAVRFAVDSPSTPRMVTLTMELPSGSRRMRRGETISTSAAIRCPAGGPLMEGKP